MLASTTTDRSCSEVSCHGQQTQGMLAVYAKGEDCTKRLRRHQSIKSPGIPVQLTDATVEIRDGTEEFPIKLPALQKHLGESLPALVGMLADGTLVKWDFSRFFGRKKFILENGQIKMVDDFASDLFSNSICAATCEEIESSLGVKTYIHTCPGEPDRLVYQLCRVPTCCCTEADFPSLVG